MTETFPRFSEGDSVVVREGVEHPVLGDDIGGWQGWIVEMLLDETYGELAVVAWDSVTLREMPPKHCEEAEEAGIDFTRTALVPLALERATPRDDPTDAFDVASALDEPFDWDYLGKQVSASATWSKAPPRAATLSAWSGFLAQNLGYPLRRR